MTTRPEQDNRRRGERLSVALDIRISCLARETLGQTINVSAKGCCVVSRHGVRGLIPGRSFVILWMNLPGEKNAIRVNPARVRWVNGDRFGLEFIAARGGDVGRLERFLGAANESDSRRSSSRDVPDTGAEHVSEECEP